MGPRTIQPKRLFMLDKFGNEIEFKTGTLEIERDINHTYSDDPYITGISETQFCLAFKAIKPLTRKKFIKILMSKGIQRNGANEIAKYTLRKKGSYDITDLFLW